MFRLTLPKVAHKSVTKSPLAIGIGDEVSLDLDKNLNIDLVHQGKSTD